MKYQYKNNKITKYNESIKAIFPNSINVEETFCIDEKEYRLINELPFNDLSFRLKGNVLSVNNKLKVKTQTYEDIPMFENEYNVKIQTKASNLVQASKFVALPREQRKVLQGVSINDKGSINASDSFRAYILDNGESEKTYILSTDFINELAYYSKLMHEDNCELQFGSNFVKAIVGECEIYGRLIIGVFPNLKRLVQNDLVEVDLDIEELKKNIEIGKNVGEDVYVTLGDNKIHFFTSLDKEGNEYTNEYKTNISKITFSLKFFQCGLNVVNKPTFYYKDSNSIAIFVEDNKTIILLPVRM